MKYSFKKKDKILKTNQFVRVKKMGRKKFTSHLILLEAKNNLCYPRLGLIARKSIGNSVQRNHLKRIVREFFRCNKSHMNFNDYIIIFKVHTLNSDIIRTELRCLFKSEN